MEVELPKDRKQTLVNHSRWQGLWSKHLLLLTWVYNLNTSWNTSCFPSPSPFPPAFFFKQIIHRLFMWKYIKSTNHWNSSLDSMILSHFQRAVLQTVVGSIAEPCECIPSIPPTNPLKLHLLIFIQCALLWLNKVED